VPFYDSAPPYFLLFAGLLAGIASGIAFKTTLEQAVQEWARNRSTRTLQGIQLLVPFIGIAIGACVFLSSGLEIFGFPTWLAYAIALPLTAFISLLVWYQLSSILVQLEKGGSKALDLDLFN
jgi:cobalamin biosynthesis protein CobD/CbiB